MMNFTPFANHFASVHQFSAAGKTGTVQTNASTILVPSTNASHYHHSSVDNHVNYSNNNHIVSTIMPGQHHHQDLRHLMNQNNPAHPPNTSQSNWVDLGLNRSSNEPIKSTLNIPAYSIQASSANTPHTIQWPLRTVITQNVSTMTEVEKPENLCKNIIKDQEYNYDSDCSSKSATINTEITWDSCSKINLKRQENVMAEYLARLHPSSMPLAIQQFLQHNNIKVAGDNCSSNKKKDQDTNKSKSDEIRISTALDGSTLFCCSDCHMAYSRQELLEQHMADMLLESFKERLFDFHEMRPHLFYVL